MNANPCSLPEAVRAHRLDQRAITVLSTGQGYTRAELLGLAARYRRGLFRLGLMLGDGVESVLLPGPALAALLLACWESGLHLRLAGSGRAEPAGSAAGADGFTAKLRVTEPTDAEDASKLATSGLPVAGLTAEEFGARDEPGAAEVGTEALEQLGMPWAVGGPVDLPERAVLSGRVVRDGVGGIGWDGGAGPVEAMTSAALMRSARNFRAAAPVTAGTVLLSGSGVGTLEAAFVSLVVPLALGLHVVVADGSGGPAALNGALPGADLCELAAADWLAWADAPDGAASLPEGVRAVCGSGWLRAEQVARVEARLGRVLWRGFGTAEAGAWAVALGGSGPKAVAPGSDDGGYVATVRPLRSPLWLRGREEQAGEIVLQGPVPGSGTGEARTREVKTGELRTGAVGFVRAGGRLEVAGRLADVVVRGGHAALLTEVDDALAGCPGVKESRTFREMGASPTEKAVCVCVGTATEAGVRAWLGGQGATVPERMVVLAPEQCAALPAVPALRAAVSGQAGRAVVAALTARRFRRNPAHDEAGLAAAVERALLRDEPLEFLQFWGCGPRRHAAGPERAAVAALGDLLAAAAAAAPLRVRAHVICTDGHATNNGHSAGHFGCYFGEVAALARELPGHPAISFELESAVWRRGGLSREQVVALEREAGFAGRWERFALRERFIQQAGRHSKGADKEAAARHYYATCLLERDILRSLFPRSVFLTYNGPEFNECFPDLPTLYVYPGPRGRNDKPWFVHTDADVSGNAGGEGGSAHGEAVREKAA